MDAMVRSALEAALVSGNVARGIELLRDWLVTAQEGEPETLLRDTPPGVRPKLALLMRDLLARYPATLVGAPVLMFAQPDSEAAQQQLSHVTLPFPTREAAQPCADLHFLGWLPVDTALPVPQPFRPERYRITVPWFKPSAAIAVFRSHPGVFDLDTIELPNMWWAELFRPVSGSIRLSSRMLLPYPDALEAARVMLASANAETPPERGFFLSDNTWHWAHLEGSLFHETCRHLYSDDI
ncbi:hypothetical protein [Burkholderia ambifaria]|uniref:hypothetical protein n=1 Tax=Burkholderia ambifaria TaxID=152480 RepID=UPI000F804911|nr:hypothetical protein [Burkholderia ambifaria]